MKSFSDFVASPFFNKKESVELLSKYILANPSILSEKEIDIKGINQKLKTNYTTQSFKKELFVIGKLIEEFIQHNNLNEEKEQTKLFILLKYCVDNRIHSLYKSYNNKLDQLNKNEQIRFGDYFLSNYKVAGLRQKYNILFQETRSKDNNIQNALDSLDKYFLIEKLDLLRNMNSRIAAVQHKYVFRLKEEVLELSNLEEFENIFSFKLENLIYLLQNDIDSLNNYKKIRILINDCQHLINKEELNNVIMVLSNSMKRIFTGIAYYQELYLHYKLQIKLGLILNGNNVILSALYKNIITVAINLKELDWALEFLNEYAKYLPKAEKNEVYHFNLANIQFEKNDFSEALDNLNNSFPKDILITLAVKRLYLKLFYELNDFSLFDSFYHSLNMFTRRLKSSSKNHILANKLFLKNINSLVRLKLNPNSEKADFEKLLEIIKEERILPEKTWLLRKVEAEIKL